MKNLWRGGLLLLLAIVAFSGCATVPEGPSVMVYPAPYKPFEVFQAEDAECRQWASQQAGTTPNQASGETLASGAAIGAIAGAAMGAAIGAATGNPAAGAAIGGGSGLVLGTATASGPAYGAAQSVQTRYDMAYQQCMYAKGNQIPGVSSGRYMPPPPPPNSTPSASAR